jgi:hypothetical protein
MVQTYRVRYCLNAKGESHSNKDVVSVDVESDLEHLPEAIPTAAYILYIENLTANQNVHWTRWPKAYRPGFGGSS